MTYIAIVDYDVGNVKSISNALSQCEVESVVTRDSKILKGAAGIVLPGVGAFSHGMDKLKEYNLDAILREIVNEGMPLLGICLGMQILFESSTEFGFCQGLAFIPGKVTKLKVKNPKFQKLPHVSWNELMQPREREGAWENSILAGLDDMEDMYFVHSFCAQPDSAEDVISYTLYSDNKFCSTVQHNNIYGCQYHPEKSASAGLKIINNFKNICKA